jgi:hypothetical protein
MINVLRRIVVVCTVALCVSTGFAQPATKPATTKPATMPAADFPPVTLRAAAIAPEAALAKIADQTGAILVTDSGTLFNDGQSPAAMLVDVQNQPFWVAMDGICRGARVGVRGLGSGDEQIAIFQSNENKPLWGDRPSYPCGPALFIPEAVTRTDHRDFFRSKSAEPVATVSVDVWTDPRLKAMSIAGPVRLREAVDERGHTLPRDPTDVEQAGGANGAQWSYRMNVRLLLPSNIGKRIARLRGEVTFVTITNRDTFEVKAADAEGKMQRVLGFPVEIKDLTIGTGGGTVRVGTIRGNADAAEWGAFLPRFGDIVQQIQLLDENGTPMRTNGWGSSSSDRFVERSITYVADNNEKAKPTKLVWVVPTETRDVTVPFELKDLVLP